MSANGESSLSEPKIALALSGGGARAMAFHLGCLRALHDLGILDRVRVLSTVSGGSVIGALYAASDDPFPAFEARVRAVLARGLARPAVRTALLTTEGLKAFLCFGLVGTSNLLFLVLSWVLWLAALVLPAGWLEVRQAENWHLPFRRFASRTTILRRTMDDELFKGKRLSDLRGRRPLLIVNAAELRTGSAFYFTPNELTDHGGLVDWRSRMSRSLTLSRPPPRIRCSYRPSTRTSRSTSAMEHGGSSALPLLTAACTTISGSRRSGRIAILP